MKQGRSDTRCTDKNAQQTLGRLEPKTYPKWVAYLLNVLGSVESFANCRCVCALSHHRGGSFPVGHRRVRASWSARGCLAFDVLIPVGAGAAGQTGQPVCFLARGILAAAPLVHGKVRRNGVAEFLAGRVKQIFLNHKSRKLGHNNKSADTILTLTTTTRRISQICFTFVHPD